MINFSEEFRISLRDIVVQSAGSFSAATTEHMFVFGVLSVYPRSFLPPLLANFAAAVHLFPLALTLLACPTTVG